MINKFIKIKSIGKFSNYSPSGDTTLKKINIIYGENAIGKTTLSMILRSLKNNDSQILNIKKTFNSPADPEIEIRINNANVNFNNGAWSSQISNLEIFDINFINENVCSGPGISLDNKRKLHSFVVGDDCVQLTQEINEIKSQLTLKNSDQSTVKGQISSALGGLSFEQFMNLKVDTDINQKIDTLEKQIESVKNYQTITSSAKLTKIPTIDLKIDFNQIADNLSKSINIIQSNFIKVVEDQKNKLGGGFGQEDWLKYGLESIKNNHCPFCDQDLSPSKKLIEAYSQFFNAEYTDLRKNIQGQESLLYQTNIQALVSSVNLISAQNNTLVEFWKTYIKSSVSIIDISKKEDELKNQISDLKDIIHEKSLDLIKAKDPSLCKNIIKTIEDINKIIDKYNQEVDLFNGEIDQIKANTPNNSSLFQIQLAQLKAVKRRHEEPMKSLCDSYTILTSEIKDLNTKKDQKQVELDKITNQIFSQYQQGMDKYLGIFNTDYRVEKLSGGNYRGTSKNPCVEFNINISGCEIKQEEDGINPCIKNSLSEGDRSALALSLFLSKTDLDSNISSKTIIFDDPLSSFDDNKRFSTINILLELSQKAEQLIVLTHSKLFASDLWAAIEDITNCKTLKVCKIGATSSITEWDLENDTASQYCQDFKKLEKYLSEGSIDNDYSLNIARKIRPVLEDYLRLKYPDQFARKQWLGDFINAIRNSNQNNPLLNMKNKLTELEAINTYSRQFHHGNGGTRATITINDVELTGFIKRTIDLIHST